jgi:hypothetical protein
MTRGIPKKRQRDEQLRKKRVHAAPGLAHGAMNPLKAISGNSEATTAACGALTRGV